MRAIGGFMSAITKVFTGAFVCSFSYAYGADIQCSCPNIAADGVGNSSCSASELDSRCTVDFNFFSERVEQEAADFLEKNMGNFVFYSRIGPETGSLRGLDEGGARELGARSGGQELIDQIMIYSLVASLQNSSFYEQINPELFRRVYQIVRERTGAVASTFSGNGAPIIIERADIRLIVVNGCIEYQFNDVQFDGIQWFMFKTFWSSVAQAPRCGGE
jgi:hypothetical protein